MLKGIPPILSPELLKALCEMGHGDEIVIADGNFAAEALGKRVIRVDASDVCPILDAVLSLMPLDPTTPTPVTLMSVAKGDNAKVDIWDIFRDIVKKHDANAGIEFEERFAFYERTKKAFAVIATSEMALYANVILKKGLVRR
jgi:L-fucose mutarotase